MTKNTIISGLIILVVVLFGYVLIKNTPKDTQKNQENNLEVQNENVGGEADTSFEEVVVKSLPADAKKIEESKDKKYTLYASINVKNRFQIIEDKTKLNPNEFGKFMFEIDSFGQNPSPFIGDSLYLKENTSNKIFQIYSDPNVSQMMITTAKFSPDSKKILYTNTSLHTYDIIKMKSSVTPIKSGDGCSVYYVRQISPDVKTAILNHHCQEGGGGMIVDIVKGDILSKWFCYIGCSGNPIISYLKNDLVLGFNEKFNEMSEKIDSETLGIYRLDGQIVKSLKTYQGDGIFFEQNLQQSNSQVFVLNVYKYNNEVKELVEVIKIDLTSLSIIN